jgi:hypothetical protein
MKGHGLIAVDHEALNHLVAKVEFFAMEKKQEAAYLDSLVRAVQRSAVSVDVIKAESGPRKVDEEKTA